MTRFLSDASTFAEAANMAEYEFYELAEPRPAHQWAGGYGFGSAGITQLEILCAVDNQEISNARLGERGPQMPRLELPITIELVEETRDILVDGSMTEFRCVRIVDAEAWAGLVQIDA